MSPASLVIRHHLDRHPHGPRGLHRRTWDDQTNKAASTKTGIAAPSRATGVLGGWGRRPSDCREEGAPHSLAIETRTRPQVRMRAHYLGIMLFAVNAVLFAIALAIGARHLPSDRVASTCSAQPPGRSSSISSPSASRPCSSTRSGRRSSSGPRS
jgi:hypothetical protein